MTDEEKEAYIDAVENDDSLISSMKHGTGEEWYEKTIALSVVKKIKEIKWEKHCLCVLRKVLLL